MRAIFFAAPVAQGQVSSREFEVDEAYGEKGRPFLTYLGAYLFCFASLLFRLSQRHRRRINALKLSFRLGGIVARLVYQHASRRSLAVYVPCAENPRLGRRECLCFLYATQFGFVCGKEERRVGRFRWIIGCSRMWSGNCGKRDRGAWMGDIWCLRNGIQFMSCGVWRGVYIP